MFCVSSLNERDHTNLHCFNNISNDDTLTTAFLLPCGDATLRISTPFTVR